jgi:hypothetical protein
MPAQVTAWLDTFAQCVRERDTERARPLFADDCFSYGTRITEADGLDMLVEHQWTPIWNSTSGFDFDAASIRTRASDDGSLVMVAARWSSHGAHLRHGRCTFLLRGGADQLVAVHSHFSLVPSA